MQKKIKIKNILPNPFRDMDSYPVDRGKVDALRASYRSTGYWGNIIGREVGGKVEIAYGHHRLIAIQEENKPNDTAEIIVRKISDADMIRIMADENMTEWSMNSQAEQETVRSVVLAYASGKIELEIPTSTKARATRFAPSFRACSAFNDVKHKPYNAESIAKFLGGHWMCGKQVSPRIRNALAVLEAAEELDAGDDFQEMTEGIGSEQAKLVVKEVKAVKKAHEDAGSSPKAAAKIALHAGKDIATSLRKGWKGGGVGTRGVKAEAEKHKPPKKKNKEVPDIEVFVESFIDNLNDVMKDDNLSKGFAEILNYKEYVSAKQQKRITSVFGMLITRCNSSVNKLQSPKFGTKLIK